jgi:hypothetical protein
MRLLRIEPRQDFVQAARRYCALIDAPNEASHENWLLEVVQAIALLYQVAMALPEGPLGAMLPMFAR